MRRTPAGRPQFQARGLDLAARALLNNGTPFPFVESAYRSFLLLCRLPTSLPQKMTKRTTKDGKILRCRYSVGKADAPAIPAIQQGLGFEMSRSLAICKRFHEKAGLVKYCFLGRVADEADRRPTGGAIHLQTPSSWKCFWSCCR